MLPCYRPAQPPPGLLSPVWSERSPCSLYRPVHTCLSPPSYPAAMGLSVSRPGAYPEVLGRYCELLLGVGAAGAASDTSVQPLAHQGCEGLCPSCLFHQDPCSWRGGDSKLLCVSQNPAPRPSLPCHLGPSSSVIGGFWGRESVRPLHPGHHVLHLTSCTPDRGSHSKTLTHPPAVSLTTSPPFLISPTALTAHHQCLSVLSQPLLL